MTPEEVVAEELRRRHAPLDTIVAADLVVYERKLMDQARRIAELEAEKAELAGTVQQLSEILRGAAVAVVDDESFTAEFYEDTSGAYPVWRRGNGR